MALRHLIVSAAALVVVATIAHAETIKVGVTAGPHAQILDAVKPIAAKNGLDIQIVEFTDYVVPNAALDSGDLQANSFQNRPYLDNQNKDRGYKIEPVGLTVNLPMGVYSKKYKSWDAVPQGGTLSIPNDPTNGGRVLLLLQDKGVLKLKPGVGFKPTVADIVENPRKFKIVEVDAAQTARTLDDVDAAAVNTTTPRRPASIRSRTRSFAKIPRGPTPISSPCAPSTRTSPGSRFWSTAIIRRKSESSCSLNSRAPCYRLGEPPPRRTAARYSCWFSSVSSKDTLSAARSAMRSFAADNIRAVVTAAIELLFT
jgi:D-methionine transport system substrate-binding protein